MPHLTPADWRFCGRWILATTIAIALCNPLGPYGLFAGPVVLGIAQGYALRHYWPDRFLLWGIVTMGGGLVAIAVFFFWIFAWLGIPLPLIIFSCGAIMGVGQAFLLRRISRRWAWWPLISGLVLAISLFWYMPEAVNAAIYGSNRTAWQWLLLAALAGLIGSALKGLALTQFLKGRSRQPVHSSHDNDHH